MLTRYQELDSVKTFLTLPEIRPYAFENHMDNTNEIQLDGAWLNYNDVGVVNIHPTSSCAMEIHGYILRANRNEYADMMDEGLLWFKQNTSKRWVKLSCKIPVPFESTVRIAQNRMQFEGLHRASYTHNNIPCDVVHFGILKDEING